MATNLTISNAAASVGWTFTNDNAVGGKTVDSGALNFQLASALTNGSGANQASKVFVATRTVAASGTDDLDLSGGLTDVFGNSILLTKVKGLFVYHSPATTASAITLGGAASNQFLTWVGSATDKVKIPNGYFFALAGGDAAGFAVTAGTGDLLRVTNLDGANTATYTIAVYGA